MALGVTVTKRERMGGSFRVEFTVAFDSSYPTGGESLTPADLGVSSIRSVEERGTGTPSGYQYSYDTDNNKLFVFYYDYNNASDGPAIQVPNTTDISALTAVKLVAWCN